MGTFNFSNMQGGQQQETQNIPREFRPAVEQAKTEPVGSYGNNKTDFWDEVKNFFSGADVDTGAGFIDETGTWNNGTKQELAKYYPTQKSAEELEKDRLGSLWDRAYKKYHYSKDDVLLEAKKISAATNIPENAILANADNLANARNVYNYQQKAMDPQAVFKAYPELSELAKLSDTDAAIALHNLKNVRQTQGIIEAAKTGWELDNLMSERGRMGYAAMNGKELTDADFARLGEIEKAQKNSKELPGLFEDPMSAIVGGTVQSGKMMLRNALNGQKMGVYGAGFGALLGGIAGGGATLGAGTAAGAAAGAKIGYSVGSRIGMAQDMYDEIAGNNYLDYRGYKDKQGRQLLTDNQARSYAAVAAALETGIEFANADKILNVIKGGAGAQSIKEIISSAKDSTELQSLLAAYLRDSAKNIGTVAISESAEEGVQEMSNRIISDIAAANNPGGDIPTYTAKDVIVGGLEASWQALPASIGFGAGAHGASTVSFMRRASAALQLKSEEQRANLRDANGISMLRSLAEDIKNNALFKKAPEVYNEVLNNQLKGTELETINIDTEYVLNQQGGYELLKSAAKAAGIGEQYLKDIIDTKADLKISTADYVSKLLPTEIGAHLEDYITFSDISECLARNREYAGRMRREMDRILAYENRQREDALNTYLDNNFHTPETREIAEAVLRRFPDNPKEGVKEIRKSLQAKIDEPLNQIIEELEKGMGNGVAVVEIPEYDNQMRGRGIKVSNNDPWYQRYYKENKHKPSKMELRELAREIWTGHNEYGLFGWENRTPEDNQWYENNKASMEATEEAIRRLDALTPALEEIDPGELSITEGLSEEGFEVYRKLRGKLEGAESKEVRQAAQMSAILAARMADRMAELHRQVGHTKYTALDYARSIGLIRSKSEAAEQKFNQAITNPIIVFGGRSYSMDSDQRGLWQLKGQTAFKTTGEKVISLFKAADQSTFMHEMAHIYLHDMLALAELPNAPKQLLDDVVTINQWAAWNDTQFVKEYKGTAMESEFKKLNEQMKTAVAKGSVEIEGKKMTLEQMQRLWMQERFARGFENYLKSGDAPTEATRSIFRRFKQWLTKIYRAFSQIGGAPSKEVKAVMDRMIASEDEIDIAMRKKGVDDFAESGGMDYLEGSTKDVYRRMVERAKADAEEKVLKIALKDVKEDYRQQEKELFEREEAEYREKLAAEPVFIIQEHIKNNPDMSTSAICETLGKNVEDYVKQLREYGGSLDAAVKAHMKEFKEGIDNSGIDAQYFRERAEEVVQESKYRKLATAMELEAFERIAKKQRNLTTKIEAEGKNDAAEKGVIKTVDKMTRQSKQIEELTAETKGLKQDKRELLANVRGLRDAALSHYKDYVQYVEMKLEVMPIEDANNYQMWRRKSAQAQYNSEQSLVKGNWDKAVKYKQAQLIYDMFADRAVRNAKQTKKIEDGLKRKQQTISKAKNISADERYAYNHLMYVFGFSDADAPVPPHYGGIMEVLMKADATREEGGLMLESPFFGPDGQTNLPEWFLQAAMNSNKRKAGHKDLSNMQVDLVAQVMHIIYKRGMDNMKLATIKTKDGRTLTVDEAVAEIEGQTRQRMIERTNADPTGANKNRWQDDAANFIDQADRVLIKPEVELKKLGDVALRYIYDPLKEAADKELKMAVNMQNKLKGLFDAYSPKELADMRNKRLYDFGSSKITKEQAIMIALNWGTETNQQRVLDGYHVNVAQVKNVLQYLDERDWNLVNSIWKLYDIHWDQIREIEARMTGAVLQKQEAKGFVVVGQDRKIYTLNGGYFPIKYDLRDLRTQEQADAAQQSAMSNIAMSLGKGFLKERTQHKVERRLDLRFEVISGSITDVIHLVAFREPVRDVRRIVLNENFKNLVYNYLGQNAYKNLKKWTSDCWAEEPIPRTAYEKGMAKLRNAQTMGTMGFRVTTALLNIANAPSVAHYMGAAELLHSLKKFYSAPRRYTDFVFQRSVFMAERAETMDASIHDALKGPNILDGIPGIGKAGEAIKNNAFKMITWTDLMLALPLWQHEYEKTYNAEVDAGRSPQQAREAGVNAGDAAVRWCFGSGRTVDKAAIQRKGSELMKQLTMYYSYNSTVYNALNYKLWEAKVGYKKAVAASAKNKSTALMKAVAHAGDALLMWVLLPAVISALLRAGASGDDDDWKIEKLIKSMGQESLTGIVGGIPVLRDAVPYFMAKVFDEHQFAPKIPIQNTIEQTNRVIQSAVSDKKTISDTLREMGKLTSQVTGAPSTLIDSFTTTLQYLESGFDESVADYLRALIFDKKLKKNQK